MIDCMKTSDKKSFFLLTECGLSSRLQLETKNKSFIGTCTMCKYMKDNSLENILSTQKSEKMTSSNLMTKLERRKVVLIKCSTTMTNSPKDIEENRDADIHNDESENNKKTIYT